MLVDYITISIRYHSALQQRQKRRQPQSQLLQRNTDLPLRQKVPKLDHQTQTLHIDDLKSRPELLDITDLILLLDPQTVSHLYTRQDPALEESLYPHLTDYLALVFAVRDAVVAHPVQFRPHDVDEPQSCVELVDCDLVFVLIRAQSQINTR